MGAEGRVWDEGDERWDEEECERGGLRGCCLEVVRETDVCRGAEDVK